MDLRISAKTISPLTLFVFLGLARSLPQIQADEWHLDLLTAQPGQVPAGWKSALYGIGSLGRWEVKLVQTGSELARSSQGVSVPLEPVIAQLSADPTDERYPLLVYTNLLLRDFRAEVEFMFVDGAVEQMAGLAFRLRNETNFYIVRASRLGNTFRFYKVVDGQRSEPIGPSGINFEKDRWYKLTVECEGNRIRTFLDDRQLIPDLTDYTFREGYIALWTKSDSIVYFRHLRVTYVPLLPQMQEIVDHVLKKHNRLVDLRLYAPAEGNEKTLLVVAAKDPTSLGTRADEVVYNVLNENRAYAGKVGKEMVVTLPIHDRNGDPKAVLRVVMKSFFGQTRENALLQALPIAKEIEKQLIRRSVTGF